MWRFYLICLDNIVHDIAMDGLGDEEATEAVLVDDTKCECQ